MSKTPTLLSLYYLTSLILIPPRALLANSDYLKIKMIHPDSPESPFFQSNLSSEERIKRLVSQSHLRANHLAAKTFVSSSFIGTQVHVLAFFYLLKIGIGTFNSKPPYKEYYFQMDTGSDLIWMQCEGCTKCFDQTPFAKPFPARNSSSFRTILDKNTAATYNCRYLDGSTTSGILAKETFYLRSKSGNPAKIRNIIFGCGLENNLIHSMFPINKIAGTIGLGWSDLSLVKQLGLGKFSYCLPHLSSRTSNTYLDFGNNFNFQLKSTKKTRLYRLNGKSYYFVNLQGISINKRRLRINPNVFAFNHSLEPGCIIDTGTPISRVKTPAFEILKQELEKYISRLEGLKKLSGGLHGLELCYERVKPEKGADNLPEVTFHLEGSKADFVMKPNAVYKFYDMEQAVGSLERFCLAMVKDDVMSTIGSRQQVNKKITYNIRRRELVFDEQDCSKNT